MLPLSAATIGAETRPCDGGQPGRQWCDASRSFEERAAALVRALEPEEKAELLVNDWAAVPRFDMPPYDWWTEGLHGVARDGVATSFPQVIGLASSLNKTLWGLVGDATATEARGKHNRRDGRRNHGLTLWAPNININRDPRWGRGQETPGEDPAVNREFAIAYVNGTGKS